LSVRITCDADDCLVSLGVPNTSLAALRQAARAAGWHVGIDSHDRDLCPACLEAEIDHQYSGPPQDEGDDGR
jgi:hypothetical protein